MSTDLAFWGSIPPRDPDPTQTYEALSADEEPAHLVKLPVTEIADALVATFPGAVREPNGPSEWVVWESPDLKYGFEVTWLPCFMVASLRGPWPNDVSNRIIDVMGNFSLPLYDPQTEERFDSHLA